MLTRGKLHVEMLGADFPGECAESVPAFVAKVRATINIPCHDEDKPTLVFVDRAKGFYNTGAGIIADELTCRPKEATFPGRGGLQKLCDRTG